MTLVLNTLILIKGPSSFHSEIEMRKYFSLKLVTLFQFVTFLISLYLSTATTKAALFHSKIHKYLAL